MSTPVRFNNALDGVVPAAPDLINSVRASRGLSALPPSPAPVAMPTRAAAAVTIPGAVPGPPDLGEAIRTYRAHQAAMKAGR